MNSSQHFIPYTFSEKFETPGVIVQRRSSFSLVFEKTKVISSCDFFFIVVDNIKPIYSVTFTLGKSSPAKRPLYVCAIEAKQAGEFGTRYYVNAGGGGGGGSGGSGGTSNDYVNAGNVWICAVRVMVDNNYPLNGSINIQYLGSNHQDIDDASNIEIQCGDCNPSHKKEKTFECIDCMFLYSKPSFSV